jgi:hypothetical protein
MGSIVKEEVNIILQKLKRVLKSKKQARSE